MKLLKNSMLLIFLGFVTSECVFADTKLINIYIVSNSENETDIFIDLENQVEFTETYYEQNNKLVIVIKECFFEKGSYEIHGNKRIVKQVRWSYHEDENAVYVVLDFKVKPHYQITRNQNKIIIKAKSYKKLIDENTSVKYSVEDEYPKFIGQYGSIPDKIKEKMEQFTWKPECPVSLQDLAYLNISYWGYDDKVHQGELIVHKDIASEVFMIFIELFENKFPIERMDLIYKFKGNDEVSMAANNTSAFNCRMTTGNKKVFSKHSYGLAIDINPLVNPYVKKSIVLPPDGKKYLKREKSIKGIIVKDNICYNVFVKRGWKWGGNWMTIKDYQHFEKIQ